MNESRPEITTPDLADEDFNLWIFIAQVREAIYQVRQKELSEYGISGTQAAILFFVQAIQALGKKATPTEIARWTGRKIHSVSEILTRMEKEGWIARVKDLDSRQMVRITLTEKGLAVYEQSMKRRAMHTIMSALSREERGQLRAILSKLLSLSIAELGSAYEPIYPHLRQSTDRGRWEIP